MRFLEPDVGSEEIPAGWRYNPSARSQRNPIVLLAIAGFFISSYLALYQYDILAEVWEPFFGSGSVRILNSPISRMLPVSDATFGAVGFLAASVAGSVGSPRRWMTIPWIVILFGIVVVLLAAICVWLTILQYVMFDSWCTLCLSTAAISVMMVGPSMDEVLASLQYLKNVRKSERSIWMSFWGLK